MAGETRVIFDTDIGTDVDDCLALALLLASPELRLEAVTCVHADVLLRCRMALKLLKLAGREDVPVLAGVRDPLVRARGAYWVGHEGEGLLAPEDDALQPAPEHAVDYLMRIVTEHPGAIHLAAVGPLTNVALAMLREPALAENLGGLTIMGGAARGPGRFHLPYAEHNIRLDPEAAQVVFSSGAPITLVPLDVTTRVWIDRDGAERIRRGGTPFHEAVAQQAELYPRVRAENRTNLHDPLAIAAITHPELVTLEPLHIDVGTSRPVDGATLMRTPSADAPLSAQVALDVDAASFEELYLGRVGASEYVGDGARQPG